MTTITRKPVTITLLDDVNCKLDGLSMQDIKHFQAKLAVFAPGYFFSPKYKIGAWDGKISFFYASGNTYIHMLDDILPDLKLRNYAVSIVDNRKDSVTPPSYINDKVFDHVLHPDSGLPIILRDYQVNSVNAIIDAGTGIILASTGSGKTLITAAICYTYGNNNMRTITIVPNQDLIQQTKADYVNCGLDVGEYSGNAKQLNHQHVVSTWQALQNNPLVLQQFQVVVVDECHGAKGPKLWKMLSDHAAHIPFRFGVTGTLPKDECEQMQIRVVLGTVQYTVPAHELIDRGVLAEPDVKIIQLDEDVRSDYDKFINTDDYMGSKPPTYAEFKANFLPDFSSEQTYLEKKKGRAGWIASYVAKLSQKPKGNTLCLVKNIAFGRRLAEMIPGSVFVNGQDFKKTSERKKIYDMFKNNDNLVVIATSAIASTGLNIRRIFHVVMIDAGKSFTRVIQTIGRGLRTADDKTTVEIHDICGDFKYSKKHLADRVKYYKEAKYPYSKKVVKYWEDINVDF